MCRSSCVFGLDRRRTQHYSWVMIPEFDPRTGNLPVGIHRASWVDSRTRFGTNYHRERLVEGLRAGLELLAACGCDRAYVDGSFVTAKELAGDFDVCWSIVGIDEDAINPIFLDFSDARAAQKDRFGGEFFPAEFPAHPSGITYLDFFQRDRDGRPKGIVVLRPGDVP